MKTKVALLCAVSGLAMVSLACWVVMFLAGHDVWQFAGKPDFWQLQGTPYTDLRVFAFAFYGQFIILLLLTAFAAIHFVTDRRSGKRIT